MGDKERSKGEPSPGMPTSRRRFLKALGAGVGAHFVLLNDWVFSAQRGKVDQDINCGREGNWSKPSAVFEDHDCGKKDGQGGVYTDEDCGKQSPYIWPGNSVWWDSDCGKVGADGHEWHEDNDCGLSRAGLGGAWSDGDCKKQLPNSPYFSEDNDCALQTGGLSRWVDGDCELPAPGEPHGDAFDDLCRIFW